MPQSDLPEDVRAFVVRRIPSVPHLEALLLMHKDPAVAWTDEKLSRRIYVSREQAGEILRDLARHALIAAVPNEVETYCFDPTWDDSELMMAIANTYRRQLVQISRFIHANSASGPVRAFARAFKLKRDE